MIEFLLGWLRDFWCAWFHPPGWPVNGQRTCRICWRVVPVRWHAPGGAPLVRRAAAAMTTGRGTRAVPALVPAREA